MVTFAGAADDERPTENHVVLVKMGGGALASGDPWKCLTRGVPAENQAGRNAPLDHPQPFPDGRRALVGTNVLDGSPHLLTSDDCKPETTRIFPVRWNVTADGSGPGGSMRELRLSPDGVTLGWSSYSFTSAGIGQFSYVGRLAFNPAPTTGEPLTPRYELTDVFRLFSPAPDDQPFRLHPDHPG